MAVTLVGPHPVKLKEGDKKAPEFTAVSQIKDGKTVSLKDYKGKKVILYFYPKDDTPGCTAESCNLRDNSLKCCKGRDLMY